MLANTYQPGSGVFPLKFKGAAAIARRIEWLGQMEDRRKACLNAGDRDGLPKLAAEYAERNMPQTAHRVAALAGGEETR